MTLLEAVHSTLRRLLEAHRGGLPPLEVFLYRRVLDLAMPELHGLDRARRPVHLPAVPSPREVLLLLDHLGPSFRLITEVLQ